MSLNLYLSHTGKRYAVSIDQIPSPEALRQWVASNVGVWVGRQILMTGQGKNVKQQHLVDQSNIFIYDKRFLLGEDNIDTDGTDEAQIPELIAPPSELENETSLAAWQALFKARRAWTIKAVDIVRDLTQRTTDLYESCENIDRSTNVALDNLKNHVSSLQNLFNKTQTWAQETVQEHQNMLQEWSGQAQTLQELPIRDEIGQLMSGPPTRNTETAGTMYSLLDSDALDSAHTNLDQASETFRTQVEELASAMGGLNDEAARTSSFLQIEWPNLESESLLQEAETLAKKVNSDYEDALRAGSDNKAIVRISKIASQHTSNMLPGLTEIVTEAADLYQRARNHKSNLSGICVRVLKEISKIQSTLQGLQHQISSLAVSEDGQNGLESLDRVFRLPTVYGSILIEAIRRSEWNDKTVGDLKSIKDELSQHKDDELRRRKKWTNAMSGFLNQEILSASANSIAEFTFPTPANPWPFVSREEIFAYVDDLRALEIDDAAEQITQGLRELDSPARQRPKPTLFKNGSVNDSRQSSFLQNGGDDARSLQDENTRLQDKLRAYESRVRKLEDTVHRQSIAMQRPQNDLFSPSTDFSRQPSSPVPSETSRPQEFPSRRSSVSVRRPSNQTPDEKAMVQRIVSLEAQINKLQQEAYAERRSSTEHREKMEEAESVKRDLLANFEAQRQEFEDERQRLEDDNHEVKIRLEELEEELDRVVGSRDHERMKQEQAISHFRSELERTRKTDHEEIDRLREAKDTMEHELAALRDKYASSEQHLHRIREEKSHLHSNNMSLAKDLRKRENEQQDLISTLQSVYSHLSPAGTAPDDAKRLANTLEVLAEGATIHARGLDDGLQKATAQNKADAEKLESFEIQINKAQTIREDLEQRIAHKDERLRALQHTLDTVRSELSDERSEVEYLRTQFAAGETGSDALRTRLTEEEQKVEELTDAKNKSEVQVDNLQNSLKDTRDQIARLNQAQESARAHLASRGKKARDLSERLFQHNDRMVRMLEAFGYIISRQGDVLLIQRASKINASQFLASSMVPGTTADFTSGTPMKRQVSGSVPIQHYFDASDAQTLYWTSDEIAKVEDTKFDAFIATLSRLDTDASIDLVTKRYKDVETIAKRYQKDAKQNREKTHRLTMEAHEKIAYRSFKEGDLALFLPTRNQATKPWAAFNVGAPHYFLHEQDVHRLQTRDWLLARINKIEERVVDYSRSMTASSDKNKDKDKGSMNAEAVSDGASLQSFDENPFELSDGLRWYLIDASEERPGAPSTPGLAKSTVAASVVDVNAQMGPDLSRKKSGGGGGKDNVGTAGAVNAAKTLHKSLDSRRSSEASRTSKTGLAPPLRTKTSTGSTSGGAAAPFLTAGDVEGTMSPIHAQSSVGPGPTVRPSDADSKQGQPREDAKVFDVARRPAVKRAETGGSIGSAQIGASASATARRIGVGAGTSTCIESPQKQRQGSSWDKLFSFQYSA